MRERAFWNRLRAARGRVLSARPQFTLRSLLILITAIAIWCRILASWERNSAALRSLRCQGARVTLGIKATCHDSPTFDEQSAIERTIGYERLGHCLDALLVPRRARVSFAGRRVPTDCVNTLYKLSTLEAFSVDGFLIENPAFGDRELIGVSQISSLRSLSVCTNPDITDAGVSGMCDASQLEELMLADCPCIKGPGLESIAKLRRLRVLYLGKLAGAIFLAPALRNKAILEELTLVELEVSSQTLGAIASLPHLRSLSLRACRFVPGAIAALECSTTISKFDLAYTEMSDADLPLVARIKALQTVDLTQTRVTAAGAASLVEMCPSCIITH